MGKITMSCRRRIVTVIGVAAVAAFLILVAVWSCGILRVFRNVQEKRVRLLCETDHHALLQACQELSRQVAAGELHPDRYHSRDGAWYPAIEVPQVIGELRPVLLSIDTNGRVVVSMAAGLSQFGAVAYPDGYQEPHVNFHYGDRELIPNLWYFDMEYERGADYDRTVDSIMRRHGGAPGGSLKP